MAPNPRISKAFRAMRDIGINEIKVKPVLKKLLKLYDKNWELIEQENYRVLADAMFEDEDDVEVPQKKQNGGDVCDMQQENFDDESETQDEHPPLKRLRLRDRVDHTSYPLNNSDVNHSTSPEFPNLEAQHQNTAQRVYKRKEPLIAEAIPRENQFGEPEISKKRKDQDLQLPKQKVHGAHEMVTPKDEPHTDDMAEHELPITVIHPDSSNKEDSSSQAVSKGKAVGNGALKEASVARERGGNDDLSNIEDSSVPAVSKEKPVGDGPPMDESIAKENGGNDSSAMPLPKSSNKENSSAPVVSKEKPVDDGSPMDESVASKNGGNDSSALPNLSNIEDSSVPAVSKEKPVGDGPPMDESIAREDGGNDRSAMPNFSNNEDLSGQAVSTEKLVSSGPAMHEYVARENRGSSGSAPPSETSKPREITTISEESSSVLNIASSPMGEVKISISFDSVLGRPDFHMPSIDDLVESMEEKCLRSYNISDPNFSVMNLMKDMCEVFLELGTDNSNKSQEIIKSTESRERIVNLTPVIDMNTTKKPIALDIRTNIHSEGIPSKSYQKIVEHHSVEAGNCAVTEEEDKLKESDAMDTCRLVVFPQRQLTADELRSLHDVNDITRGEERIEISRSNDIDFNFPQFFHYISQSIIFQNAHINISLSRIGDEECCKDCFGDCLSSSDPCVCAGDTMHNFAYTSEGLIKENFLEECISMIRAPQHQNLSFCRKCPLERLKNDDVLEPCKGHLKKKYIKECWIKCGCHRSCGNRVVQRGISCKLQVFFTSEGKGWGLRTLQNIPKGSFVCEYVGEIITNSELNERNIQAAHTQNHMHPVPLDAYWYLKEDLKDEEALFLDATSYGNVARFINHRCLDANLIDIPVGVESRDHHFYHVAFFTTRDIDAMEELTWDYGIDFDDDQGLLVKAFQCNCGSKFCRNIKRSPRTKSLSNTG